jgi:hypothetical protein
VSKPKGKISGQDAKPKLFMVQSLEQSLTITICQFSQGCGYRNVSGGCWVHIRNY